MATLHLGVIDIHYGDKYGTTTGKVAEILEDEYHVMRVFFEVCEDKIDGIIAESIASEIERLINSKNTEAEIPEINTSKIDELFKEFLASDEWQHLTGQIIAAAIKGISKRFKDRYNSKKNRGSRPAFIDSGQYQNSFKSWID